MKEKHNGLIILIKVFSVLTLIDLAVVAIVFPIICCFVEFDNEERAHLVYNILLFSCFGFGTAVFILMPICGKLLIRNKPHQVEFPCDNMSALWNGVQSHLISLGYYSIDCQMGDISNFKVYKKQQTSNADFFIIISDLLGEQQKSICDLDDITALIGTDKRYSTVLLCCSGLNQREVSSLKNLSTEKMNMSCLVAVLDIQKSKLFYNELKDGYAVKRNQKRIKNLLSVLSIQ